MKNSIEKGSALILVLLVVAILTAVGVNAVDRLQADINRSVDFSLSQQSYWYALGLESRVSDFLKERHKIRSFSNVLIPDQDIPSILVQVEGGNIEGKLFDLKTCFNVNSLVRLASDNRQVMNQSGVDQYKNLLELIGLDEFSQDQLIFPLVDWIYSDDFTQDVNGAEDDYYTRLDFPYRTPNQPISDISELVNIKNYDAQILQMLSPFICVLPEVGSTGININAVPIDKPEILVMLLGNQISINSASDILFDRPLTGFADVHEFLSHPELLELQFSGVIKSQILTDSNYYLLTTEVSNFNYPLKMKSVMHIKESGNIKILMRTTGVF